MRFLLSAVFVALGCVAAERQALANSGCQYERTFAAGAKIPQSVIGVPYVTNGDAFGGGGGSQPRADDFRLLTPAGSAVASTLQDDAWWPGGKVAVLAAPPAVGTGYKVEYTGGCYGKATEKKTIDVEVIASPPVPTTMGTLSARNRKRGPTEVSSSCCPSPIDAVSLDLVLDASPELYAYRAVTGFKVFVDDAPLTASYYGGGTHPGEAPPPGEGAIGLAYLWAQCGVPIGANAGIGVPVSAGVHTLRVEPHLLGSPAVSLPAVSTTLDFRCDSVANDGGSAPSSPAPESGGCSTTGRPESSFAFVVALVALAVRRTRRGL